MDKEVLGTIRNVDIFPIIALAIFFIFFAIMLVRVLRTKRTEEHVMADIPLHDGTTGFDEFTDNLFENH